MKLAILHRLLILVLLAYLSGDLYAQKGQVKDDSNHQSVVDYEALTMRLYMEQKWDSLLVTGKEAIAEGYDYFYIQVRTGTAAFYLGRYSLAGIYLDKAYKLNNADEYTRELLFLTYMYTGRQSQAALLTLKMSPERSKILYGEYINPLIYAEGGPIITTGKKSSDEFTLSDTINFTEKFAEKNATYFVVGVKQPLGPRIMITTAVSYLDFTKYREDNIRYVDSLAGDYKVKQAEFYISPTIGINRRLSFAPAGRMTRTTVTEPIYSTDSITKLYLGNPIAKTFSDYLLGGELSYAKNYWKVNAGAWYISVSEKQSLQLSSSLTVLPLGNLDLYTVTGLLWNNKRTEGPFVLSQAVGSKIFNNTWLEINGSLGNLAGTAEFNGQLLNNQINKSNNRLTALLIRDLSAKLRISLRYQFMHSESTVYYLDQDYQLHSDAYQYHRHIITGGITWNVL